MCVGKAFRGGWETLLRELDCSLIDFFNMFFFFSRQEASILAKQGQDQGYTGCIQEKQKDYLPPTNLEKLQDAH